EGGEEGAGFVNAFLIFAGGGGVGNDAAAGLNVGDAVFDDHGAESDAGIEIAGEVEIENAAGVDAAARAFDLFDDFHGADVGGAGDGASRKTRHERVEAIDVFAEPAAQRRHDVHHVREALDGHELLDLDAAVFADAAEIIAAEVDEHDVLGAL